MKKHVEFGMEIEALVCMIVALMFYVTRPGCNHEDWPYVVGFRDR
jgi:hypothetical protein